MKIGIANDHRGVETKNKVSIYLKGQGYEVVNYGTNSEERIDYPNYAFVVSKAVINKEIDLGILFCGTGIGMSIAANKVKGIRCAKINTNDDAYYAKNHNNANVLAFGVNNNTSEKINELITIFLDTKVNEDKNYKKRNEMVDSFIND